MASYGGLTALRAALGAIGGGFEGYAQSKELERRRKLDEEAARRQTLMDTLAIANAGGMPTAQRQELGQQSKTAIGNALTSLSGAAFGAAPAPIDSAAIQRGIGAVGAPAARVQVGGVSYDLPTLQEKEQADFSRDINKLTAQQKFLDERQSAKDERENRGYFDVLQKAGEIPPNAVFETYRNAPLKPTFDEYLKRTALQEAMERAKVTAYAPNNRGGYLVAIGPDGKPEYYTAPSGGGPLLPTGLKPVDKTGQPSAVERRGMTELESSIKELDKAIKAVEASPSAFGMQTILPNVALSRRPGVKPRADVTAAIVKLRRTEFGTAMSKQEKESGQSLFPAGGDDAKTVIDKLNALKEKAQIDLQTRQSSYPNGEWNTGTGTKRLEDEFPSQSEKIKRARANGYTDEQIRARLAGGR